jgi:hypothetical protein
MPTSAFFKFFDYVEQVNKAVHNWSTHTFKMALTNTAPNDGMTVLADITQIAATGGYTAGAGGGYTLDTVTLTESNGEAKVTIADEVITASGGNVGPFRYLVVYNDTASSPADALCFYFDYGSAITLADTETLTSDFPAGGVWTMQ